MGDFGGEFTSTGGNGGNKKIEKKSVRVSIHETYILSSMEIEQNLNVENRGQKGWRNHHLPSIHLRRFYSPFRPTLGSHDKSCIANFEARFSLSWKSSLGRLKQIERRLKMPTLADRQRSQNRQLCRWII